MKVILSTITSNNKLWIDRL